VHWDIDKCNNNLGICRVFLGDFRTIDFKIQHNSYVASGSGLPSPPRRKILVAPTKGVDFNEKQKHQSTQRHIPEGGNRNVEISEHSLI